MILPQSIIDQILRPRFRRRMLHLPFSDTPPVAVGRPYRLQTKPGTKARVTITVTSCVPSSLADLTLADAKRCGFGTIEGAQLAEPLPPPVWAVCFVRGDESAFFRQAQPVFLTKRARDGGQRSDYTTRLANAVIEDGVAVEVAVLPGAGEQSRVMALARMQEPQRRAIHRLRQSVGTLREAMAEMKVRNADADVRMAVIEGQLDRMEAELPVQGVVISPE